MRKNRYGSQDRPRLPKGLSREDEDLTLTLDHFAAPMGFRILPPASGAAGEEGSVAASCHREWSPVTRGQCDAVPCALVIPQVDAVLDAASANQGLASTTRGHPAGGRYPGVTPTREQLPS